MPLTQKLKKLRRMSADEIRVRVTEFCSTLRERLELARRSQPPAAAVPGSDDRNLALRAVELVPGCRSSEIQALQNLAPDLYQTIIGRITRKTDDLLAGRWKSLGHPFQLLGQVNWHQDPVSGYEWPRKFYADLSLYGLSNGADVKFAWELSRHQFLFELAARWALTGETRAADRARTLWIDWIRENPVLIGANWTSALECAMRIIAWMWSLAALAEWPGWQPGDLGMIRRSLEDHARYLCRHLSYYSSPYNHLIGEATGLYLAGTWLSGAEADHWRELALRVLRAHSRRQFSADGFTVEQACGYHFYSVGFLTLAREASVQFHDELSSLDDLLALTWRTGALFRQPDGKWSPFGDLDSARALPVLPDEYWDFRSLLSFGAARYGDPVVAQAAEHPGEELFWLRGTDGVRAFQNVRAQPAPLESGFLPEAGYAIGRSTAVPGDWLLFDCGPISDGLFADSTPSTAHGHSDLLQVLLFQNNEPVLIDSGMDTYAGDIRRVDWFRSSEAHNTLEVDGAPPVRPAGRLAWSHAASANRVQGLLNSEFWLTHGGYRPADGIAVDRFVLVIPGAGAWIADRVETAVPGQTTWTWHPGLSSTAGEVTTVARGLELKWGPGTLQMTSTSGKLSASLVEARVGSVAGWKCHGYGERTAGRYLRVTGECPAPASLVVTSLTTQPVRGAIRLPSGPSSPNWPAALGRLDSSPTVEWLVTTADGPRWIVVGTTHPPDSMHDWTRCSGVGESIVWSTMPGVGF